MEGHRLHSVLLAALLLLITTNYGTEGTQCSSSNTLTALNGYVQDHTGGGNYATSALCVWYIQPNEPNVDSISVIFEFFDLEWYYDYIVFFDGPSVESPQLVWFSGNVMPQPVVSTGPALTVLFYSDPFVTRAGFGFSYHADICPNKCSGNGRCINNACECFGGWSGTDCSESHCPNNCEPFGACSLENKCECDEGYYGGDCLHPYCGGEHNYVSASGTFKDHHGGGDYLHNMDCTWVIEPEDFQPGDSIRLIFNQFDTEEDYDFVRIYDDEVLIASYHGSVIPRPVISISGRLVINFQSDPGLARTGFEGAWNLVHCPAGCNQHGYCQSEGNCICDIGFTLADCSQSVCFMDCWGRGNCINDVCECAPYAEGLDCGICHGTSTECIVEQCDAVSLLNTTSGQIMSNFGAGDYLPAHNCIWKISVPAPNDLLEQTIVLTFQKFDLELEGAFVRVYDGPSASNHLIGEFTGSSIPNQVISSGLNMYIEFESSEAPVRTGFSAVWEVASCDCNGRGHCHVDACVCNVGFTGANCELNECTNNCNGAGECDTETNTCQCFAGRYGADCGSGFCDGTTYLTAQSGNFSDHSEGLLYRANSECEWVIQPTGTSSPVHLVFTQLTTEPFFDTIVVRNGHLPTSPIIGTYYGNFGHILPDPIVSVENSLFVEFNTDPNFELTGFEASYTVASACPQSCSGSGYCVNGKCFCYGAKTGAACDTALQTTALPSSQLVGDSVGQWEWRYFHFDIPANTIGQFTLVHAKTSNIGTADYFLRHSVPPTLQAFHTRSPFHTNSAFIRVASPEAGRWYFGVYGREPSDFSVRLTVECTDGGLYIDEVCTCSGACFVGESCETPVCQNGAPCSEGVCGECPEGFSGKYCEDEAKEGGSTAGAVAAVLIGVIGLVVVVAVVIFLLLKYKKNIPAIHLPTTTKSADKFVELEEDQVPEKS